ncbi:MAG: hypothetical protein M3179_00440 [Actinomycetota bacterium]|nr:hypothetical protein [Actinomycetota bacterium]
MSSDTDPRPARLPAALLLAAAAFTAWSGYVHFREWLGFYRKLPASIPGSAVVRVGFPVTAVISAVLAVLLVLCALRRRRLAPYVVGGALLFHAASLAALIVSRNGSLFGWTEATWTGAANATRIAEVAAMVSLFAAMGITAAVRERRQGQALHIPSDRRRGARNRPIGSVTPSSPPASSGTATAP